MSKSLRYTLNYGGLCLLFASFVVLLCWLEHQAYSRSLIIYAMLAFTVTCYAGIGLVARTSDITEYYVAGRAIPAPLNGMASAADWISAASFLSLTGGLYLQGFDGYAYLIGWTGGFCLVAFLVAPYLRRFAQFTLADFLGTRFAGSNNSHLVRVLVVLATIFISFIYVVAQIYGVGLIASRFIGVDFSFGIFLGLASILVCSFLGGMRAVTWTQALQYIIILVAFTTPVVWLSHKLTGHYLPQIAYAQVFPQLLNQEKQRINDATELQVRRIYQQRADRLQQQIEQLPGSWQQGQAYLQKQLQDLKTADVPLAAIRRAERALAAYPRSATEAGLRWQELRQSNLQKAQPAFLNYLPYSAPSAEESANKRNNFLALALSLMLGTAALPHLLLRSYTASSVRQSRASVSWALFFIILVYLSMPILAVLLKADLYASLVGSSFAELPNWVLHWSNLDKQNPLLQIQDVNFDGIVQQAEITIDGDILVLAAPEMTGMPHVIAALVAAGALAAALSTADGLLLTISNSLAHDIYFKIWNPAASTRRRVTLSKLSLLVVALLAAFVATQKPADILSTVGAAFSVAASTLFPVLVMAIFWRRANRAGAIAGMLCGFFVCIGYMLLCWPKFGGNPALQWWQIAPVSAGIFGVPAGFLAIISVSYLTPADSPQVQHLIDHIRRA